MQTRWFPFNTRYLSVSLTLGGPGAENPDGLRVFILDISMRPIFALHCASTWESFGACRNFVFLITPFATFSFVSDHLGAYAEGLSTHAPFSLLLSRGDEAILRLSFPAGEGIYHALLALLNKLGPLQYFYASSLFLYPTLVLNAALAILLNLLISQLFI